MAEADEIDRIRPHNVLTITRLRDVYGRIVLAIQFEHIEVSFVLFLKKNIQVYSTSITDA